MREEKSRGEGMLKRLAFILSAICLSGVFVSDRLWAQQRVTVAYSAISPIMAGVWMAKEIGAFEKNELRAELVYISSGAITVQAMVGGDLTMTWPQEGFMEKLFKGGR